MILPIGINLTNWAASLIIDFPESNIPILTNEREWRRWADELVQDEVFLINNVPSSFSYKDWQTWASHVFYLMNNSNANNLNMNGDEDV